MLYDPSGICPKDIETHIDLLAKAGICIDDVFIDYLTIMKSNNGDAHSETEKAVVLPKEVRMLAQKTNTRIFI